MCSIISSPLVGFLRFLNMVADHDWAATPIIVNFNGELTAERLSKIFTTFSRERDSLPAIFVATPYDREDEPSMFTKASNFKNSSSILMVAKQLANASRKALLEQLRGDKSGGDFRRLFRAKLDSYHILLHLHKDAIVDGYQAVDTMKSQDDGDEDCAEDDEVTTTSKKEMAKQKEQKMLMPIVAFSPLQLFLKCLDTAHGVRALFFCDPLGGQLIAVRFKPSVFERMTFDDKNAQASSVVNEGAMGKMMKADDVHMSCNLEGMLEDFLHLGEGLVARVEPLVGNWKAAD